MHNRTGVPWSPPNETASSSPTPDSFVIEHGDELVVAGTDENSSRFQAGFVCSNLTHR
ncbi:hypothetical protein [Haloarcula sp. JP-L23]|uniref:hypothetical protein n=1 Tax=Haloarcula sp. JP-L23 TaxID=2716717 RepID=UPI00140F0544|nr:hypothetical protein G9465_19515 [Haloarcula sp. JP-L23]